MRINEVVTEGRGASVLNQRRGWKAHAADFAQGTNDAVRAAANAATFGGADYAAAAGNSMLNKSDFKTELGREFNKSADAMDRSPVATTVGQVAGSVASPVFAAGAIAAPKLAATAMGPKAVQSLQKAVAPVPGQSVRNTAKNVAGAAGTMGTGIVGGLGADAAAKGVAKQMDPDNPYLDSVVDTVSAIKEEDADTVRLKELINYRMQK